MQNVISAILSFVQDTNFVIAMYEMLICFFIFEKRKHFYWRIAVFIPYIILTNSQLPFAAFLNYPFVYGKLHFGYVVWFFVSVLLVWFCYDAKFSHLLYFCTAAYVVENLGYQIGNVFYLTAFGGNGQAVIDYHDPRPLLYLVFRELFEIPIFLLVLFVLVRKYKQNYDFRVKNSMMFAVEIATLVIIVFFNYYATMNNQMNVAARVYAATVDVLLLMFQFLFFNETRLRYESDVTTEILRQQSKQQKLTRENIETINLKCHDLRRELRALESVGTDEERKQKIAELETAIGIYDSSVKTGNDALDVLIMDKFLVSKRKEITISCNADGKLLDFIKPTDLYVMLSNAIDNAIENVEKYSVEKRIIDLEIKEVDGWIKLTLDNYCDDELNFVNGLPVSGKVNKEYHGFGCKSIKQIAEKYSGITSMTKVDDKFVVKILFPLNK